MSRTTILAFGPDGNYEHAQDFFNSWGSAWDDLDSGYAGCCGVVEKITRYEDGTWYVLLMDDNEHAMFQKGELNKLDGGTNER